MKRADELYSNCKEAQAMLQSSLWQDDRRTMANFNSAVMKAPLSSSIQEALYKFSQ